MATTPIPDPGIIDAAVIARLVETAQALNQTLTQLSTQLSAQSATQTAATGQASGTATQEGATGEAATVGTATAREHDIGGGERSEKENATESGVLFANTKTAMQHHEEVMHEMTRRSMDALEKERTHIENIRKESLEGLKTLGIYREALLRTLVGDAVDDLVGKKG